MLALLIAQGELTVVGFDAFEAWSRGEGADAAAAVRAADHQAYRARRELLAALQAALSTPLDQEDIYALSERIDRTLTVARTTVRESEVLGWTPDAHAAEMGERFAEGTRALVAGFGLLRKAPDQAGQQADGHLQIGDAAGDDRAEHRDHPEPTYVRTPAPPRSLTAAGSLNGSDTEHPEIDQELAEIAGPPTRTWPRAPNRERAQLERGDALEHDDSIGWEP